MIPPFYIYIVLSNTETDSHPCFCSRFRLYLAQHRDGIQSSKSLLLTPNTSAIAFNSISVTNLAPLSILCIAFLSTSSPLLRNISENALCEGFSGRLSRNFFMLGPHMLFLPSFPLFLYTFISIFQSSILILAKISEAEADTEPSKHGFSFIFSCLGPFSIFLFLQVNKKGPRYFELYLGTSFL